MTAWKILVTDGLEQVGLDIMRGSAQVDDRNGISADELLLVAGDYDAIVVRGRTKVNAAVLEAGKKLKVVGRAGVGVDNIDLTAAKAHGVTVVNSPLATTTAVAELTLGLMLGLVRETARADASMKAGKWIKKELEGGELYGKTLGVIGFGRIGSAVSVRASAFGMQILAFDRFRKAEDIAARGGIPVTLDEMYARADMISMHIPLTPDTKNLLNADSFAKMKRGVLLICAARGGVIDEEALLAALNSGQVGGAALDVFTAEPPGLTPLVAHPRVLCTPHIGAQTVESQARAALDIASEILAALGGEPLRWKVA